MKESEICNIVSLMRREVVPALGCTEPIAVALCAAKAASLLDCEVERVEVSLSANILKNAMGVGIPGSDLVGLPIAVALGVVAGDPSRSLEVLAGVTSDDEAKAREMIDQHLINISLKEDAPVKLYVEVKIFGTGSQAVATIANAHTNFVYLAKDGEVLLDNLTPCSCGGDTPEKSSSCDLSMQKICDFVSCVPIDDIAFMNEAIELNTNAVEMSLRGEYGHSLGKMLCGDGERKIMGDNTFSRILSHTSAACDARMAGASIPVMSNSGSGNQGIAATIPVVVFARDNGMGEEQLLRALTLSHLTAIYIKQQLGRLSALCGCVIAATGSSCGITYLMGGDYTQICYSVKNMIANLTGMICDGAKPSCSLKLCSGVSTAVMSAMMASHDKVVTSVEGIIDEDVDQCIKNLTTIGVQGMEETDRLVLDIMTHKC